MQSSGAQSRGQGSGARPRGQNFNHVTMSEISNTRVFTYISLWNLVAHLCHEVARDRNIDSESSEVQYWRCVSHEAGHGGVRVKHGGNAPTDVMRIFISTWSMLTCWSQNCLVFVFSPHHNRLENWIRTLNSFRAILRPMRLRPPSLPPSLSQG